MNVAKCIVLIIKHVPRACVSKARSQFGACTINWDRRLNLACLLNQPSEPLMRKILVVARMPNLNISHLRQIYRDRKNSGLGTLDYLFRKAARYCGNKITRFHYGSNCPKERYTQSGITMTTEFIQSFVKSGLCSARQRYRYVVHF